MYSDNKSSPWVFNPPPEHPISFYSIPPVFSPLSHIQPELILQGTYCLDQAKFSYDVLPRREEIPEKAPSFTLLLPIEEVDEVEDEDDVFETIIPVTTKLPIHPSSAFVPIRSDSVLTPKSSDFDYNRQGYNLYTIIACAIESEYFSYHLNPNEIMYIRGIVHRDPYLLHIIGNSIDQIISDGKVDLHDIPQIVLLLSDLYKSHCVEQFVMNVGVINIVKFTLDCILEYKYLPLPSVPKTLLKKYVDQSLDLLAMNVAFSKQTEKNLYYYLCCLFFPGQ